MCGRFVQKAERKIITEEFYVREFIDEVVTSYNVAPGQNAGIIINRGNNVYVQYRWGLVPSWAKDPQIGNKMINARAETVAQKPSFKSAFRNRRCLVPVDGFYEWKRTGGYKIPYFIHHRSKKPFSLAGLWETWKGPEGSPRSTFTIITTDANAALHPIHERMPVVIPAEKRLFWLDSAADIQNLETLLVPFNSSELFFHEVSRLVNSPDNNSPQCIVPVESDSANTFTW
jgi:putative SOS response-associated peptidase YedK